jgi:DNA-binding LacI/PurR family transcriptional regulator
MLKEKEIYSALPKYHLLSLVIKEKISNGEFKPGDILPPETRLAREYGMNRLTANKAISQLVQAGLLYRVQGKGTFVKEPDTQDFNKNKTDIKVVFDYASLSSELNPTNWFFNFYILQGIVDASNKFNFKLNFVDSYEKLLTGRGENIIVLGGSPQATKKLRNKENIIVTVYKNIPYIWCSNVTTDKKQAAHEAVKYLIDLGHREIGFIGGPGGSIRLRYLGYRNALLESNISLRGDLILESGSWGEDGQETGYKSMLTLLEVEKKPSAIFAATDLRAIGAVKAIREKGLRVPEDIAIVSFDDIPESSSCQPPLTTLHPPRYECGYHAVKLLKQLIEGKKKEPQTVILPTKLVVRKSCGGYLKK